MAGNDDDDDLPLIGPNDVWQPVPHSGHITRARNWTALLKAANGQILQPDQFFDVPFKVVADGERQYSLRKIAALVNRSTKPSDWGGGASIPDSFVVAMPEGYGKSMLAVYLISRGFKVIFCAKSNAQLIAKEREIVEKWPKNPDVIKILHGRTPVASRYVSKAQNLQNALAQIGVPRGVYELVTYDNEDPYAIATVNEMESIASLAELFAQYKVEEDAAEFFATYYDDYEAETPDGKAADVLLLTFAYFQSLATGKRKPWWERLNLVEGFNKVTVDEENVDRFKRKNKKVQLGDVVYIPIPLKKIAIIIDDPDRSDVDWVRRVSEETAEQLHKARKPIPKRHLLKTNPVYWKSKIPEKIIPGLVRAIQARHKKISETPIHKVVEIGGSKYVERPAEATFGYGLLSGKAKPKLIVTTTECFTAAFAMRSLLSAGLNVYNEINVFQSVLSNVTAICTTITRKRNHAVLLPIIEKLREEFPEENVTLIADGLSCEFNLSNNKGRNDLSERTTVIKVAWPHPSAIATMMAHLSKETEYDRMIGIHLADLTNQALGRNQGFRFRGKQAVLLVDSRFYPVLMEGNMIRYKLNPWSDKLPKFNKKTSKRASIEAIQFTTEQSPFERRLIELIANFESFGVSDEAQRLAQQLSDAQREIYEKWLKETTDPEVIQKQIAREEKLRRKGAEYVRQYRARRNAAASNAVTSEANPEPPDEAQR